MLRNPIYVDFLKQKISFSLQTCVIKGGSAPKWLFMLVILFWKDLFYEENILTSH